MSDQAGNPEDRCSGVAASYDNSAFVKDLSAWTIPPNTPSYTTYHVTAECGEGQEYNANTRDCDPCKQRYYKDGVGNNKACIECPLDKTTVGTGSTSIADCTEGEHCHILTFK